MTAAGEAEPRVWSELCFSDGVNVKELTVNELQELSDFCAFIRHTGKTMADAPALGSRAHLKDTVRRIQDELKPEADRNGFQWGIVAAKSRFRISSAKTAKKMQKYSSMNLQTHQTWLK